MGQQQLLLLVLGIVIVGLAVVVGIQAFGENQKKANADALTNDAVRIASDAQAWALKPAAFGGGNGSFANVTLAKLGYQVSGTTYTNLNTGTATGQGFSLSSVPTTAPASGTGEFVIRGISDKNGIVVRVCGTGPSDLRTLIGDNTIAASTAPAC